MPRANEVYPIRPERAEALSPGHRPGYYGYIKVALKGQKLSISKLLPFQGDLVVFILKPRAMPWAKSYCPLPFPSAGDRWFRACGAR